MALVPFDTPLKTSESVWVSDVFRGYRKGPTVCKDLKGDESIQSEGISYCSYLRAKLTGICKNNVS